MPTDKQIAAITARQVDLAGDAYTDMVMDFNAQLAALNEDDDDRLILLIALFLERLDRLMAFWMDSATKTHIRLVEAEFGVVLTPRTATIALAERNSVISASKAMLDSAMKAIKLSAIQSGVNIVTLAKTQLFTPQRLFNMRRMVDTAVERSPQRALFSAGRKPFRRKVDCVR